MLPEATFKRQQKILKTPGINHFVPDQKAGMGLEGKLPVGDGVAVKKCQQFMQ